MQRPTAAVVTAAFFGCAPGAVAGVVPWALTRWQPGYDVPLPAQVAGGALTAAGTAVLVDSFARFVVDGAGTPAPPAPTERLVVSGLYRYIRNPMYVGVLAAIVGQALLLGRPVLLGYAAVAGATVASFVHWYEEPTLRRQFGAAYEEYRRSVPAWWPRLRPAD